MKTTQLTVTDQFCGCGGSSQGVRKASLKYGGGIEVRLAMNHWKLAVETHNTNFPETDHDCADVQATDPRRYQSTDILITSPECTNHSLAKGVKRKYQQTKNLFGDITVDETAVRSRATMWDVPRFAEVHQYNAIIVENVVDARSWIMWDAWLHAMHNLGYLHKCVYLNSQHALPTPQSRDRMYVVFWKKGNKAPNLEITPRAFCRGCEKEIKAVQSWKNPAKPFGKYRQQYVYRCPRCGMEVEPYYYAAFNCIDWTIPAQRIGDRKKPLSPNTMRRIEFGLERFGNQPLTLFANHSGTVSRIQPLNRILPTQTTWQENALMVPGFLSKQYGGACRPEDTPVGLDAPLGTITTSDHHAFVGLPFFDKAHGTGVPYPVTEPAHSVLAGGLHHGVVGMPFVVENFECSTAKPITAPIGCQTTKPSYGLLSTESVSAFLAYYYGNDQCSGMCNPTGTMTTHERAALVVKPTGKIDINDCTYRMLVPHEIQAAMAFERDYVVLGNSKEKVRQLGNAVTPPAMELLIDRVVQTFL